MSPSLPGSKMWNVSLISYVQVTDWNYDSGGVVLFDDGTMWSYESESPAAGDQDGFVWWGFAITERKVGSDVWERLTPDLWGLPWTANPPGYPNWPDGYYGGGSRVWDGYDREGPLNVATIGISGETEWVHIQYPDDPDNVLFYGQYGSDFTGPITVNRHTRRWKTHLRSQSALDIWSRQASNIVTDGVYFYFIHRYQTSTDGMGLVRCPIGDLNDVSIVHQWPNPDPFWWSGINTSNITLPDFIDHQNIGRSNVSLAIDGDQIYFFTQLNNLLRDARSTEPWTIGDRSERNHNIYYQSLRRFKIGEYNLETLLWHSTPQGWVGYGGGNFGTLLDHTLGVTTQDDLTKTRTNIYPAVGMGLKSSNEHVIEIHNGWLYWIDRSGEEWRGYNDTYGSGMMICRIDLTKFDPSEPIHHDVMDPAFEILSNGTAPWEGGASHIGWYQGTWLYARTGAQPLLPMADNVAMTFDSDGNIFYKGMTHPPYYSSDWYGYGTRVIYKLTPNVKSVTDVIVTFSGDELKGYTNARQVPVTRDVIEVELT